MNNLIETLNKRVCEQLNTIFLQELSEWGDPGTGNFKKESFKRLNKLIKDLRDEGYDFYVYDSAKEYLTEKYPDTTIEEMLKQKKRWMPVVFSDVLLKSAIIKKDKYLIYHMERMVYRWKERLYEKLAEEDITAFGPFYPNSEAGVISFYAYTGNHLVDVFLCTVMNGRTGKPDPFDSSPF